MNTTLIIVCFAIMCADDTKFEKFKALVVLALFSAVADAIVYWGLFS